MTATIDDEIALHTDESDGDYKFFVGVRNDIRRRLNPASWLSDWHDGMRWQVLNASFFMFFASIAPPLAFAQTLMNRTGGEMGLVELVVSTAVCGAIFAICAGQPLNIVGVTGPTIILYGAMHGVTESLGAPFLPFMGWACVWAALILASLALGGGAALARTVTRFTDEIFGGLIALVYLSVAVEGFARQFTHIGTVESGSDEPESTLAGALLSLLLAMATAVMCLSLHAARRWRVAHPAVRDLLARYNTCLALLLFTAASYWGSLRGAHVERLHSVVQPGMWDGRPTHARVEGEGDGEGAGRAWVVPLLAGGIGVREILLALVPGVLMVLLLFFDHSVVALVSAAPEFQLRKGSSFHWDTLLLAFTVLLCGLLGLPPVNGVLPQSPMHVQACAIVRCSGKKTSKRRGENADEDSDEQHEHTITGVHENRVSPLLQSLLCALVLAALPGVREIPIAVLWGLFLYFGATSFYGNQLAERAASFALHRDELARLRREHDAAAGGGGRGHLVGPPRRVVAWFTAAQLACLAAVYYVSEHAPDDKARASFAILVVLLVPLRALVLPRFFAAEHLAQLDGHGGGGGHDEREHSNGDGEDNCRLSLANDREGDCDDFGPHLCSTRSSMRPSASAGLLLAYPSRSSVRTAYAYAYAASTRDSITSAATPSCPALARVTMPAASAHGGSGLQTAETLQIVAGMTPRSAPPSSRARSEDAPRDNFKAQHGEMLLRMRRREAQPDVAGFRSRRGLLNKRHPLHERGVSSGDSEQQNGWSRRVARV